MKTFNYIFIAIVAIMLLSSLIGLFFIGGYTLKTMYIVLMATCISLVTNSIYHKFFVKEKDEDERNIRIENKAKAKAFDITGIVFGIITIIYILLKSNLLIILLTIAAYLFIFIVYIVYFSKYHKEM
ncbi:MAG: DUF2178 domain-containing protein [Clostridium tyrobutyricum]|jgi:uncharacterized membrane protein|uniref:DUF2178 domain-containing protein n=1 Tax=Clostridium tyrobutyricum TaxID=1519 RepID=UPI002431BE85|nr:DUF2178 domain-containing protein [Clostridium tyrobutyricum]MCH4201173.1 DUF2178 domain-containing protein [Clostridium tyrobutyricum]MCH4260348.1 DUF2178 domain-containing protein [Clostridium tyrobutyricum]